MKILNKQQIIEQYNKGVHNMKLDQYKITVKEQALRYDSKGNLLAFKPTAGEHKTIEFLSGCELPNTEYNKHFYRPKTFRLTKILHETDELEIIDYKTLFAEEMKQGTIEQYIGDGVIITELCYDSQESEKSFLKRVSKELEQSLAFYSKDKHYATRFYLKEYAEDTQHKIAFTKIVLDNLKQVIEFVKEELK